MDYGVHSWRARTKSSTGVYGSWSDYASFSYAAVTVGYVSVSSGIATSPEPAMVGHNINVSFSLRELYGRSITISAMKVDIRRNDSTPVFTLASWVNTTFHANQTQSFTVAKPVWSNNGDILPGSYKMVVVGRVADGAYFDITTIDAGTNPRQFTVVADDVALPDFGVEAVTVAQAVPSPYLLRDKATVVRCRIRNIGDSCSRVVSGRLHVLDRDNREVQTLSASLQWPESGQFSESSIQAGNDAFCFVLSATATTRDELRFWVEVDPANAIAESDESNNTTEATPLVQSFYAPGHLSMGYCFVTTSENAEEPDSMRDAYELVARTYPIAFNGTEDWVNLGRERWGATHLWTQRAQSMLWRKLKWENVRRWPTQRPLDRIVGFFREWPYANVVGKAGGGKEILLNATDAMASGTPRYKMTIAHELGHTMGLNGEYYSKPGGSAQWIADDGPGWDMEDCPENGFPCSNYPPRSRSEGAWIGRFVSEDSYDVENRRPAAWVAAGLPEWEAVTIRQCTAYLIDPIFGDPHLVGYWGCDEDPVRIRSRRAISFMGSAHYGDNYSWIASDVYDLLASAFIEEAGQTIEHAHAAMHASPESTQLWIDAMITRNDEVIAGSWVSVQSTMPTDVLTGTGYSIELLDENGVVVRSEHFGLDFSAADTDTMPLVAAVALPSSARTIEIRKGALTLYRREVSAHAPSVTLLTPNGGESLVGRQVVRWAATDPDGDAVTADVFYSPNGGLEWTNVAVGVMADSLAWNTDVNAGTGTGVVRVLVTDGLRTTEDSSDGVFSVGFKGPSVVITAPSDSATVVCGQSVVLAGLAADAEDGNELTSRIVWGSSIAGALGVGQQITVEGLAAGEHVIVAHVIDEQGMTGADSVRIRILEDSDRDGMPDEWESTYAVLNAFYADDVYDPDMDSLVNCDEYVHGTDPGNRDSDSDGFMDGLEVAQGTDPLSAGSTPTAVRDEDTAVAAVMSASIYPNPFNPAVRILFLLPRAGHVRLTIYDIRGRIVRTVVDDYREAGVHDVVWRGEDDGSRRVGSGVYLYLLEAGGQVVRGKMMLVR